MNKTIIIGNLTHSPELKSVQVNGENVSVCRFTVAVNGFNGKATFFNVTAWRALAETTAKYLAKGRKTAVVGEVSARAYAGHTGEARASLELTASEVEFLSPKNEGKDDLEAQFTDINDDELPFK